MVEEEKKCPGCGADLPANAPKGLCPKCLMRAGMQIGSEDNPAGPADLGGASPTSDTPPSGFVPPAPAELAEQFLQLEIIELLGQGGMGAVYKARQRQLDRFVALKILPPQVGRTETFAERFTREARSLARLNHPHIVTVHDFGRTAEGLYYFIMEFVDGTDLRQAIRSGSIKPVEALAIVPQVCEALQYAHEEGIVHRDIKPENILLDKKGRVRIADFGLAKLLDKPPTAYTLTQAQQRMGTPHYMAPEQIEHPGQVDHRADIYSLGVVFYEMLTGQLPIGRFALPSEKVRVDVRLDEVVLKSLEHEPERRYQHASEIKTDVEAIPSGGQPSTSGPVASEGEEAAKRRLRIPAIGLMISGAVNFLTLALVPVLAFALDWVDTPGSPVLLVAAVLTGATAVGVVIILGGLQMIRLRSYGWAVAASALAVLPLSAGFMIGVPMGIWALIVLYRSDVQEAFVVKKRKPARKYEDVGGVRTEAESIAVRASSPRASGQPGEGGDESLEQFILSQLPANKDEVVKAYQKKTGAGRVEAVLAVDAIERKHGVEFTPVPLKQRLRRVPIAITTVGACYAFYFLFIRYVEISSILGWSIMFLATGCIFIFFGVALWRSRTVDKGIQFRLFAGFFLFLFLVNPLLFFLAEPMLILKRLYALTGAAPGPHDVLVFRIVLVAIIAGGLFWVIRLLIRYRKGHLK
jgi:tRNA A-37 threonylcarbamoyl transferase component Bud32